MRWSRCGADCIDHQRTNALQQCDSAPKAPQHGHQAAVVQGDEDDDGQRVEEGEGRGGDVKALGDAAVHLRALLNEERVHLDVYRPAEGALHTQN